MSSRSKEEIINRIDRRYLEHVSNGVNNSTRTDFHSYDDTQFIDYVKNKFSKSDLITIWRDYMLHNPPNKPVEKLRDQSAGELIDLYKSRCEEGQFLAEQRIGGVVCDLVELREKGSELNAIEVKSNGDDLRKACRQCRDYSEWADHVYLLTKPSKKETSLEKIPNWVGVYIVEGDDTILEREPEPLEHDFHDVLELMTRQQLTSLLSSADVPTTGDKRECRERAANHPDRFSSRDLRKALIRS